MDQERQLMRESILSQMAEIEDEYQQLVKYGKRLREVEHFRWGLIRSYEALTPSMCGDSSERRDAVEKALAVYRQETG